jgi:hypothetical protein
MRAIELSKKEMKKRERERVEDGTVNFFVLYHYLLHNKFSFFLCTYIHSILFNRRPVERTISREKKRILFTLLSI